MKRFIDGEATVSLSSSSVASSSTKRFERLSQSNQLGKLTLIFSPLNVPTSIVKAMVAQEFLGLIPCVNGKHAIVCAAFDTLRVHCHLASPVCRQHVVVTKNRRTCMGWWIFSKQRKDVACSGDIAVWVAAEGPLVSFARFDQFLNPIDSAWAHLPSRNNIIGEDVFLRQTCRHNHQPTQHNKTPKFYHPQ
ncbi:hypothetical protein D9M69_220550 [compost metagenome]